MRREVEQRRGSELRGFTNLMVYLLLSWAHPQNVVCICVFPRLDVTVLFLNMEM